MRLGESCGTTIRLETFLLVEGSARHGTPSSAVALLRRVEARMGKDG